MAIERIISVGISVRRGNAEMLARFTLSKDEQEQRLPEIARELGVEEIVYMATCNRVEVVCLVPMNVSTAHFRPRIYKILSGDDPQPGEAERVWRAWVGEGAVEHLFLVSSGLDSAQVGEHEIRGQVREALKTARKAGTCGRLLNFIFDEALRIAGLVHKRVPMDGSGTSLADVAIEHLFERTRRTPGSVALVGVNSMTRRAGRALARKSVPLIIVNRTPERAAELAEELGAEWRSLDEFRRLPDRVEALLLSTGSQEPVLDGPSLERIVARTPSGEPPLLVDMAIPPDVLPETVKKFGGKRIGMDEINAEASVTRIRRLAELAPARELIDSALDELRKRLAEKMLSPLIAKLNQRYRQTALTGVERLLQKELQDLDEEKRQEVIQWAEVIARRFAHIPTMGLRGLAKEIGAPAVKTFLEASGDDVFADVGEITDRMSQFGDLSDEES